MKYDLHSLWLLDKVNKNYNNKIECILLFIFRLKKIRLHAYKKIYRWILLFFYLKHSSLFLYTQSIVMITCCKIKEWEGERRDRINRNTQRKVVSHFISRSPFIEIVEEIYINMDDHPHVPTIR